MYLCVNRNVRCDVLIESETDQRCKDITDERNEVDRIVRNVGTKEQTYEVEIFT